MAYINSTALAVTSIPKDEIFYLSPYHYIPTQSIAILFLVLFGLSGAVHLGEAIFFRLWWLFPTVILAVCGELIGWSARLWSTLNITLNTPFLMQLSSTIISPTPLLAGVFVIFGRLTRRLGTQYSRLTPRLYTIVFCTSDVVALILQAFGGGLASGTSASGIRLGTRIMLAGISFQLAIISIFSILVLEYLVRYGTYRPAREELSSRAAAGSPSSTVATLTGTGSRGRMDRKLKLMIAGMSFTTLCLFIRAIYRTVELADGWNGRVISTQVYFNVLDATMVFLAMFTLNVLHPGFLLSPPAEDDPSYFPKA